jgi:hypothetical protein
LKQRYPPVQRESILRLEAQIMAKQVELREARLAFPIALASAASLLGVPTDSLTQQVQTPEGPVER